MKERPILFNTEMVAAVLRGDKTQTRRVVGQQPVSHAAGLYADRYNHTADWAYWLPDNRMDSQNTFCCPSGEVGDQLWVRERFRYFIDDDLFDCIRYQADDARIKPIITDCSTGHKFHESCDIDSIEMRWKPSIHMPRWASRIQLEITDVRAQRIQEITPAEIIAEGICPTYREGGKPKLKIANELRFEFMALWDKINGHRAGAEYSFYKNPWVWVVTFRRVN